MKNHLKLQLHKEQFGELTKGPNSLETGAVKRKADGTMLLEDAFNPSKISDLKPTLKRTSVLSKSLKAS
ncbi:hypothetical protein L596_001345 [Steinernema carpocapsae]|uniref:Uncharacterized protein n=1 Tax=Steinernema carpocapsae TaxID=34508 RepID=A0A4V6I725_STECR|nr:hypothetical protein L596_001345 [Steinernema carpocapsae]